MPNRDLSPEETGDGTDMERAFGIGALILVLLAGAFAMSPSVADPDLWGHVQFGQDTLNMGLAETTTYSFTVDNFRWINHENLSEMTMAFVNDTFGPAGLLWGKFFLSLVVIGSIIWFNFRQGVSLIPTAILTLLVAWNLGYHWSFRPQLSSFVLFTLLIVLFQFCFANWRDQWHLKLLGGNDGSTIQQTWLQARLLWLAIPIILIWTNSHGGFVAGVCIAIAYLMLRAFEAFQVHGSAGWGIARRMALISLAIALTTLLNPYSYRLPMWLLESLGDPRPEIVDWSNGQLWSVVGMKFWILLGAASFAMFLSRKSWDFVHCAILAITLWQALSHFRHVPFFAILCGFWLGPHLESALGRLQQDHISVARNPGKLWVQCVSYVALLLVIGLVAFKLSGRLNQIQVDRGVYPVDAFAFMKRNEVNGKIVVTYNWAQYTIGAMCGQGDEKSARSQVAFDGRFRTCYPQEIVDMHFDFLYGDQDVIPRYRSPNSPPLDPNRVLEHGGPDLVLIKRFDEVTSRHMEQEEVKKQWCLLYQDGLAQLWGLKSKFDDPNSINFVPPENRVRSNKKPGGIVAWPAIPNFDSSQRISQEISPFNSSL